MNVLFKVCCMKLGFEKCVDAILAQMNVMGIK